MLMLFTCEHCGARIKVDARMQGRRGRCRHCGQEMTIPRVDEPSPPPVPAAEPVPPAGRSRTTTPEPDAGFRLSPPEPRPRISPAHFQHSPVLTEPEHLHRIIGAESPSEFELLGDDSPLGSEVLASPEVQRGLRELDEFHKDPRGYQVADEFDNRFFGWIRGARPAGWVYTQWRKSIGLILRVLRFIDDWAYLISIPCLMLMIFGIAIGHRGLIHTGAVVVVLVNFGRFWTDLLSLFVRPFKDGPIHGLMFLFPPYGVYYIARNWDKFKPTFRRLLTSCIPIVLVGLAYMFLPTVDPDVRSARTSLEKARRAERDFLEDAREVGREVRQGVESIETRAGPHPVGSEP